MIDATPAKYEVLDLTPELAASILDGNTQNRNIRQRVVDQYAGDMKRGDWEGENGQSIVLAPDGCVIDGQHRLWAIVDSGTTQRMLLVSNVPMTAQVNMDTQAKRTFGDVLKLRGEAQGIELAAIVRRVTLWEAGYRRNSGGIYSPSHTELLMTLDQYPGLRRSVSSSLAARRVLAVPGSVLGLCHWLFDRLDSEDCEHFYALIRGEHDGLTKGHPVRVLHETIARVSGPRARLATDVATAYVIKAWNAYRDGRDVGLLRYRPGGANPEPFPEPY